MTRLQYIKRDWPRVVVLVAMTLALPFTQEWENPAGASPFAIFAALTAYGWVNLALMFCISDRTRSDVFWRQLSDED